MDILWLRPVVGIFCQDLAIGSLGLAQLVYVWDRAMGILGLGHSLDPGTYQKLWRFWPSLDSEYCYQ